MYHHNRYSVSLDEVGVIPESPVTYSDSDIDLSLKVGKPGRDLQLGIPVLSSAMDSVFSTAMAKKLVFCGGLPVLNLCGLLSRYEVFNKGFEKLYTKLLNDPKVLTLQEVYSEPIDENILAQNLVYLNSDLAQPLAVAATPQTAQQLFEVVNKCLDIKVFIIQASFISPFWRSKSHAGLDIIKFLNGLQDQGKVVMVGNVASLNVARVFIDGGIDAVIAGVGPGSACSTRTVLGIGSGHITSISDIREYIELTSSHVKLIADGGISNSGDIIKLMCTGAHAVMLGSMFAKTEDAPFPGLHWGMASYHKSLPRGFISRFGIGDGVDVNKVLFGPSKRTDGTLNMIDAIKNAFSNLGVLNIDEAYHKTSVVRFPGIHNEGKNK